MIFGIGTDIVQTSRIKATQERTGKRFPEKILGKDELVEYHRRVASSEVSGLHYLCNRYAAKEAFSKALGLGIRKPMSWHEIQIMNDNNGAPEVQVTGDLADYMHHHQLKAKVSLSDEVDYSLAFILIEKYDHA